MLFLREEFGFLRHSSAGHSTHFCPYWNCTFLFSNFKHFFFRTTPSTWFPWNGIVISQSRFSLKRLVNSIGWLWRIPFSCAVTWFAWILVFEKISKTLRKLPWASPNRKNASRFSTSTTRGLVGRFWKAEERGEKFSSFQIEFFTWQILQRVKWVDISGLQSAFLPVARRCRHHVSLHLDGAFRVRTETGWIFGRIEENWIRLKKVCLHLFGASY